MNFIFNPSIDNNNKNNMKHNIILHLIIIKSSLIEMYIFKIIFYNNFKYGL